MPLVSTKRTDKHHIFDSWFPYYAGYSQEFVESVIRHYKFEQNSLVYDPWAGSGTTLYTSALHGIKSIGIDVNPFAVDLTNAKSPQIIRLSKKIDTFYEEYISKYLSGSLITDFSGDGDLKNYFTKDSCILLSNIMNAIEKYEARESEDSSTDSQIIKSFLRISVILSALKFSQKKEISNPTWQIGLDESQLPENFVNILKVNYSRMIDDIREYYAGRSYASYIAIQGDSRSHVIDRKADYVITSPPYLTRIDYIVNTRIALSFYDLDFSLRSLRESSMGTPVIRKAPLNLIEWGPYAKNLLDLISQHPSKASGTYYKKTYEQYISDMYCSVSSIISSIKDDAKIFLVVQPSYYKDIFIDLSELYIEAFESAGVGGKVLMRNQSKRNMSSINKRSKIYTSDKKYYEDVLYFRR